MKSPWQIGLLAVAVTGVSTYDILFFKQHLSRNRVSMQIQSNQLIAGTDAPAVAPLIDPASSPDAKRSAEADSGPPISREELQRSAQQAFVPKDLQGPDIEIDWPRRDPFETHKEFERSPLEQVTPSKPLPDKNVRSPLHPALPEPQCVFTGTLIERERRLALIDGTPRSIGARLGIWQLARIEPDHIILEAGSETRRIELKGAGLQASRRKDPL
jgi:hypothetical protein